MQADYPKPLPTVKWDTFYTEYPVRKSPGAGVSSETIARTWRDQPLILRESKTPIKELKEYTRDYDTDKKLMKSTTSLDFDYKRSGTKRHNKHTSCMDNEYIYPPSRRIEHRPFECQAHGTTEMKSAYTAPSFNPRHVIEENKYKYQLILSEPPTEPDLHKELEPIDTTHEGFEKLLDPYLTTSRLHHRPFTAEQLRRPSNSNDIVTFYTFANVPWVRRPKPDIDFKIPPFRPKSMYDREKFKQDPREIITHNTMKWVPGSLNSETRNNYTEEALTLNKGIQVFEEEAKNKYSKELAHLPPNIDEEQIAIKQGYTTEISHTGSGKPICAVIDQHVEKNKRLQRKIMRISKVVKTFN